MENTQQRIERLESLNRELLEACKLSLKRLRQLKEVEPSGNLIRFLQNIINRCN